MISLLHLHYSGVDFVWQIYDSTNEGIDAFYLGDLLRALETNPTLATIEKLGGTKKKGEYYFRCASCSNWISLKINYIKRRVFRWKEVDGRRVLPDLFSNVEGQRPRSVRRFHRMFEIVRQTRRRPHDRRWIDTHPSVAW